MTQDCQAVTTVNPGIFDIYSMVSIVHKEWEGEYCMRICTRIATVKMHRYCYLSFNILVARGKGGSRLKRAKGFLQVFSLRGLTSLNVKLVRVRMSSRIKIIDSLWVCMSLSCRYFTLDPQHFTFQPRHLTLDPRLWPRENSWFGVVVVTWERWLRFLLIFLRISGSTTIGRSEQSFVNVFIDKSQHLRINVIVFAMY